MYKHFAYSLRFPKNVGKLAKNGLFKQKNIIFLSDSQCSNYLIAVRVPIPISPLSIPSLGFSNYTYGAATCGLARRLMMGHHYRLLLSPRAKKSEEEVSPSAYRGNQGKFKNVSVIPTGPGSHPWLSFQNRTWNPPGRVSSFACKRYNKFV